MMSELVESLTPTIHEHLSCELLLTTFCNMRCVYCVAGDLTESSMSIETGRKAIDMFIDLAQGATSLEVVFTGGEPLLEFKTMKNLTRYAQELATKTGTDIHFIIKTNGTVLNGKIIEFLGAYHIKVVISIDGTEENHNKYRKDSVGNGTHHIVLRNLKDILQKPIPCAASITVHPTLCTTAINSVRYLHQIGVEQIDLGPAYGTVLWTKDDSLALAQCLHDVARYMRDVANSGKNLEVGPLYQKSEHIEGRLSDCWGCGAASTNIAFMPNGQIAGCSSLGMLTPRYPELILGDVWNGLDEHAIAHLLQLTQAGFQERPLCQQCEAATNCTGGCLAINYSTTALPLMPPPFYCKTMCSIPSAWQTAWGVTGSEKKLHFTTKRKGSKAVYL